MFREPLKETKKEEDIMAMVNEFFGSDRLSWDLVRAICIDSALAILKGNLGFTAHVKKMNTGVTSSHCILRRHALALNTLPFYLQDVLEVVIRAVNFIRARALNHRMFKALCEEAVNTPYFCFVQQFAVYQEEYF
jgi:hypothetical protein